MPIRSVAQKPGPRKGGDNTQGVVSRQIGFTSADGAGTISGILPHFDSAADPSGSEMGAQIIDGKAIAAEVMQQTRQHVAQRVAQGHRAPGLAVVLVGTHHASQIYVRNKRKACEEIDRNPFAFP